MVTVPSRLADHDDPLVRAVAERLTAGETTPRGKLARLFAYVRDDISFGFPLAGDLVPASEVIRSGSGQCNTKSTLLLALCRAAGIPVRIHFSLIGREIQRGFFKGLSYWLMPRQISHSWIEVEIDGRWRRLDAYINDLPLQRAAVAELHRRGWQTGLSVALPTVGEPATDLDLDDERFVQMDAVTEDHGIWDDPAAYYASPAYRNRPGALRSWLYRRVLGHVNERIARLRRSQPPLRQGGRMA